MWSVAVAGTAQGLENNAASADEGLVSGRQNRGNGAATVLGKSALDLQAASDVVRVFDREPDLLCGVDDATADLLRRRAVAPKLWLEPGPWRPPAASDCLHSCFGFLVLDGLLTRSVVLGGRDCPELIGPGDLVRPWDQDDQEASLAYTTSWKVLQQTSVAVLDGRFAAVCSRWPSIMVELLSRAVQRSRALALHLAIVHARRADTRLLMLLWHLADRFGRVTPEGVHIPLPLRHELLGHLACVRRPTASTTLQQLVTADELVRRQDGTWLLTGSPPGA